MCLQINLNFRRTSKALPGERIQRCVQDEPCGQDSMWLPCVAWHTSNYSVSEVYPGLLTSAVLLISIDSILDPTGLFLNHQLTSEHDWCLCWLRICQTSVFPAEKWREGRIEGSLQFRMRLNLKATIQRCIALL